MPTIRGTPSVVTAKTKDALEASLTEALVPVAPEQNAGQIVDSLLRDGSAAQIVVVDPVNNRVLSTETANFLTTVNNEENLTGGFCLKLKPVTGQSGRSLAYEIDSNDDFPQLSEDAITAIIGPRLPTFTIASLVNALMNAFPVDGDTQYDPAIVVDQTSGEVFVCVGESDNQLSNALDVAYDTLNAATMEARAIALTPTAEDAEPEALIFEGGAS